MFSRPAGGLSPAEFLEKFLKDPLPETIVDLRQQIELIEQVQAHCAQAIKEAMAEENLAEGKILAAEIHDLKQQKNMLETQREFRRVKLNRILGEKS